MKETHFKILMIYLLITSVGIIGQDSVVGYALLTTSILGILATSINEDYLNHN